MIYGNSSGDGLAITQMNDLIKQLSSYNLFNYLFPGTVFCVGLNKLGGFDLIVENLFAAFFFYYFIGLTISRVSSLIVEPILKKNGFIKMGSYADFIKAEKKDSKIEVLSEVSNVYRTLISLPICAGAYWTGIFVADTLSLPSSLRASAIMLFLAILFAFSYRKQNSYVVKRISANLDETSNGP